MEATPVDRCVCRNVLFADLWRLHQETGAGFRQLQTQTGCGTVCGMCIPYIKVVLKTGRVRLPVMGQDHRLKDD
jgi:bacterioferritin-associated ferredoxin